MGMGFIKCLIPTVFRKVIWVEFCRASYEKEWRVLWRNKKIISITLLSLDTAKTVLGEDALTTQHIRKTETAVERIKR